MIYWPQGLVAALLITLVIVSIFKHGDEMPDKKINAVEAIWRMLMLAAVLGAGGFWSPR